MVNDESDDDTTEDEDGHPPVTELEAQILQGIEDLKAGETERAIDLFSTVALQARAGDLPLMEASACGMLGQALLLTGRREEGLPYASRALEIAEAVGNAEAAENFQELLRALEASDEAEEPEDDASSGEEGEEEDETLGALNARIKAAMDRAMVGDPSGAIDELIDIAGEAQRSEAPGPEASAQIAIGQLLLASGNADLAAVALRRALAIAEALENLGAAEHIREILGRIPE